MIKAVFLDLDDTLLLSPDNGFLGGFISRLVEYLEKDLGASQPGGLVREAARRMMGDLDPTRTNLQIWQEVIGRALPERSPRELTDSLMRFYQDIYPALKKSTRPDPHALRLVEGLLNNDYVVVIATNPLYPKGAISQRIQWAGLEGFNFARITDAENSHFTKPQPHYYEEILADIDCEPSEAIMVGDSWTNDILPANQIGMRTYWINTHPLVGDSTVAPDGAGTLAEFADLALKSGWLDEFEPLAPKPSQMVPRLIGDVGALMGMVDTTPDRFWNQRPDENEWTLLEILVHLEESERTVQRPRLQKIAQEDDPFLRAPKEPFRPGQRNLDKVDPREMAHCFAIERGVTATFLAGLPDDAWSRPARHSIYGLTNLLEMTVFTTRHDRLHIQQFCQTTGKCE